MEKSINEILIETTINQAIKRIQDDPERSTRNLVDIGLNFSNGRFQRHFLELIQGMLQNEQSAYYRMIPDLMASIDTKRIMTFGMNVGYHSCTKGARMIRSVEDISFFNVPWCVALEMDAMSFWANSDAYYSLIEQGESLGIYTWIIYCLDDIHHLLELAENFPDSAFLYCCTPQEISPQLLDEANELYNIMFAVSYREGIEEACHLLRSRKFLYSILFPYQDKDVEQILSGEILTDLENLHPVFSFFQANTTCSPEIQSQIYHYLQNARLEQIYQTLPFDIIYDTLFIDSIISEDGVMIRFDEEGNALPISDSDYLEKNNLFEHSLVDIFKNCFPKKAC